MTDLRIYRYLLPSDTPIWLRDFTIECEEPLIDKTVYVKGVKTEAQYLGLDNELVVKKTFTDLIEDGFFIGVSILIEWFNTDGSAGVQRTIPKQMGKGVANDYLRKRRQRSISYLQIASKGTPIESHVATLLKHYKDEVDLFIQGNTSDFELAVLGETNTTILSMLNIVIDAEGTKVRDSILNQIT